MGEPLDNDLCVKFGSPIALLVPNLPGYVGAEGFANMQLNAIISDSDFSALDKSHSLSRENFRERLFVIVPAQQYSAAEALAKFYDENPSLDPNNMKRIMTLLEVRLRESAKLEQRLNVESTNKSLGSGVVYGQMVQLLHTQSNKFVSIRPRALAETEKDAMKIELSTEGSSDSHFLIVPKYKHILKGDPVLIDAEVTIQSCTWHVHLHVGKQLQTYENQLISLVEINGARTTSTIQLRPFSSSSVAENELKGGDMIRLYHYESHGYLAAPSTLTTDSSLRHEADPIYLQSTRTERQSIEAGHSVRGLWQIQNIDVTDGNTMQFNSKCILRHVHAREFLAIRHEKSKFVPYLTPELGRHCHWFLRPASLAQAIGPITISSACYLQHALTGCWICVHDAFADFDREGMTTGANLALNQHDAFRIQRVDPEAIEQALFVLALLPQLELHTTCFTQLNNFKAKDIRREFGIIIRVLKELICFCTNQPNGSNVLQIEAVAILERQTLLFELNLIKTLIELIQIDVKQQGISLSRISQASMSPLELFQKEKLLHFHLKQMLRLCYRLLTLIIQSNPKTTHCCLHSILIFTQQLGYDIGAEELVEEIFINNPIVLDQMDNSIVLSLIERVQQSNSKTDVIFCIEFLDKICCCKGQGINSKQQVLANMLFPLTKDKTIRMNDDVLFRVKYQENQMIIEIEPNKWCDLKEFSQTYPTIMNYFMATIHLLASMCASRNYNCIYAIEIFYPRGPILAVIENEQLDYTLRATFADLLESLYIDRLPHSIRQLPHPIITFEDINSNPLKMKEVADFEVEFFDQVKAGILRVLQSCQGKLKAKDKHRSRNGLILKMLKICCQMLEFGLYSKKKQQQVELIQLLGPLLRDSAAASTTSLLSASVLQATAKFTKFATAQDTQAPPSADTEEPFYIATPFTRIVMECRIQICQILHHLLLLDLSENLQSILKLYQAKVIKVFPSLNSNSLDEKQHEVEKLDHLIPAKPTPSSPRLGSRVGSRFQSISKELKKGISAVTALVDSEVARKGTYIGDYSEFAQSITNDIKASILDDAVEFDMIETLIELLLYQHPELVASSLNLLRKHFNRYTDILDCLRQFQIVLPGPATTLYHQLRTKVELISMYEQTSETWIYSHTTKTWQCIIQVLQDLADILTDQQIPQEKTRIQKLFACEGVHEKVMSLMKTVLNILLRNESDNLKSTLVSNLETVVDHCCMFLMAFVHKNCANQLLLEKELSLFKKCIRLRHLDCRLLTSIYQHNFDLCIKIEDDFISFVVHLIEEFGPVPDLLEILSALAVCSNTPIKENQIRIIQILMEPHRPAHVLKLYNSTHEDYQLRIELLEQYTPPSSSHAAEPRSFPSRKTPRVLQHSTAPNEIRAYSHQLLESEELRKSWIASLREETLQDEGRVSSEDTSQGSIVYEQEPLLYHLDLLDLLSKLTLGENFVCEARVQGLLSISDLIEALNDPQVIIELKTKLLLVLHEGWMNTEQPIAAIAENDDLMECFNLLASQVLDSFDFTLTMSIPTEFHDHFHSAIVYIFDTFLPTLRTYFDTHCHPKALHPLQLAIGRTILASLTELVDLLREQYAFNWSQVLNEEQIELIDDLVRILRKYHIQQPLASFRQSNVLPTLDTELDQQANMSIMVEGIEAGLMEVVEALSCTSAYSSRIHSNRKRMLEAFMNLRQKNNTSLPSTTLVVPTAPAATPPTLKKSGQFSQTASSLSKLALDQSNEEKHQQAKLDQVIQKLIDHAAESEVRRGKFATTATMQVLHVLSQLTSYSSQIQDKIASLGATEMLVHLFCYSNASDDEVHDQLITFGVALLKGGSKSVQSVMHKLLSTGNYDIFFDRIAHKIHEGIANLELATASVENESDIQLFEFLRLLCEGHNEDMQNLLRCRSSSCSINLVSITVEYFGANFKVLNAENLPRLIKVLETITEMSQGPCENNQLTIVDTQACNGNSFVEMTSSLLAIDNDDPDYTTSTVRDLKFRCTLALISLLEGRADEIIHERMASLLPIRLLKESLVLVYIDFIRMHDGKYTEEAFHPEMFSAEGQQKGNFVIRMIKILIGHAHLAGYEADTEEVDNQMEDEGGKPTALLNTGFNIYILFQRLLEVPSIASALRSNILPSHEQMQLLAEKKSSIFGKSASVMKHMAHTIREERYSYAEAFVFFKSHCSSIELVRNNKLQRFYFPTPPACEFLTKNMKKKVMHAVNRESPTQKLEDLFHSADELIDEMTHRYKMSFPGDLLFTYGKDISFLLAICINLLVLNCYVSLPSDPEEIDPSKVIYTTEMDTSDPLQFQKTKLLPDAICVGNFPFLQIPIGSLITALGITQTFTSCWIVLIYLFSHGPLIMLRGWKKFEAQKLEDLKHGATKSSSESIESQDQEPSSSSDDKPTLAPPLFRVWGIPIHITSLKRVIVSLLFLLRSPLYLYYLMYIAMTIAGLFGHNFFYAFHLCDVLLRYPELTIVLHAVVVPYKSLILTFLLFVVCEYFFSVFSFTFIREHYALDGGFIGSNRTEINLCDTLSLCFYSTFDMGFKNDGGIGGFLTPVDPEGDPNLWIVRFIYDNLFNILMLLVLMNIVFGIIIDTFADQRNQMQAMMDDMISKCYICSIERSVFDRSSIQGYNHHIEQEHNLWNYVFLVAHLRFKELTEFDGVEQYIWDLIQEEEWTFIPLYRAMALQEKLESNNSPAAPTVVESKEDSDVPVDEPPTEVENA